MPKTRKAPAKKQFKRSGALTEPEKDLVTRFIADQPGEITPKQQQALATVLRRSPDAVKTLLQTAKDRFVERAGDYVDVHMQATREALATQDYDTAVKASQWAITNISSEGERIIEKETVQSVMPRVVIGVNLGGLDLKAIEASDGVIVDNESR